MPSKIVLSAEAVKSELSAEKRILAMAARRNCDFILSPTLRVQVPKNHILTQNLYYNSYDPKPKCQIIGCLDPLSPTLQNPRPISETIAGLIPFEPLCLDSLNLHTLLWESREQGVR